jgi:hypothetical protein
MHLSRRFFTPLALLLVSGILVGQSVSPPAALALAQVNYSGAAKTIVVPGGVSSIHFEISGASGGDYSGDLGVPGSGGKVSFDVAVAAGDTLKLEVGGEGGTSPTAGDASLGGYPDGGAALNFDDKRTGGGGGSTRVFKMNGATPTLIAIAAGGGGSATQSAGGHGGGSSGGVGEASGVHGTTFPVNSVAHGAGGGSSSNGGVGALANLRSPSESFDEAAGSGSAMQGGNHSVYGGAGGGGGYFGGGGGLLGLAGGGGSSWWDTNIVSNASSTAGANTGNGWISIRYDAVQPIDNTFTVNWSDGLIALGITAIGSGPAVNGNYELYDSATVTGTPLATATVNGNGTTASSPTSRNLTGTRFAVRFVSNNSSYTDQIWENLRAQCGTGSFNEIDGFIPCTRAPVGSFVAAPGATSPTMCPAGSTTRVMGANACVLSETQPPSLVSPQSAMSYIIGNSNPLFTFRIPELPLNGTVQLRWFKEDEITTHRELTLDDAHGTVNLGVFDPLAPNSSMLLLGHVMQSTTTIRGAVDNLSRMPVGSYTFTISYQNYFSDPASSISSTQITLRMACDSGYYSSDGYSPCDTTTTSSSPSSTTSTVVQTIADVSTPETSLAASTTSTLIPENVTTTTTTAVPIVIVATPKACTVKKSRNISRSCLIQNAKITVAASSKVVIKVAAASKKVCALKGTVLKALKKGTCSTTLTVTPKGKKSKTYKARVIVIS